MSYIQSNKAAWEEAFDNKQPHWGDNNYLRLKSEYLAFFNKDMQSELENINFKGKVVAQFCCNNGRELLSLVAGGAGSGVGFDIAENIIKQAQETAEKAGLKNCSFVACNILEIPASYANQFDIILFTIGALTWFKDLPVLFAKAAECLKPGGLVLINDFHPVLNMLPIPGEAEYDPSDLKRITYPYFQSEPRLEDDGMDYMSVKYKSKTFTSFVHTMAAIINGLAVNSLKTTKLNEYDYDIMDSAAVYDNKGFPLSFILRAEKC
ncbi:MAG: class I SAM-dependent methyltransferase [Spirochaetaceae bacterium]|nr:class I SAM-dependent methyltransferase [Spirochaetaceae bacterium]